MNAMLLLAQVAPALTDSIAGANPVLTPVAGPEEMNLWSMAIKGGWIMIVLGLLSILCLHLVRTQLCDQEGRQRGSDVHG